VYDKCIQEEYEMAIGTLKLTLTDALGKALDDSDVVIELFSVDTSKHYKVTVQLDGQKTGVSVAADNCGNGFYRVLIWPSNYAPVQFFIHMMEVSTSTREPVVFPVNPEKVVDVKAPGFHLLDQRLQTMLNNSTQPHLTGASGAPLTGEALYEALSPILKAALLNLFTKSSNTVLDDGKSCFDHLGGMVEVDQDRLFAKTNAALQEEAAAAHNFHPVNFLLHKEIPPYHLVSSFKTKDVHGNLQLTFERNGDTGDDYLVDMDIDEAQELFEHLFEITKNAITGLTNPYVIRDILAKDQKLMPLYDLVFAERGVVVSAAATT